MRKALAFAVALLAPSAASSLAAEATYPHTSKPPLITGTVVSANDYQIVVDTGQGQPLTLDIDSRTLVPANLSPGMRIQAEFRLMENGRHYAGRIAPARPGTESVPAYGADDGRRSTAGGAIAGRMPETLPQTASRQPLIALLGLLGVGIGGFALWTLRPRRA